MSTYSVPGDWFDTVAAPDDDDYQDFTDYAVDDDEWLHERLETAPACPSPVNKAIMSLRQLSRDLQRERHPLAGVPWRIANELLVDVHAPAPAPASGTQPSPTGNCRHCGDPLPLPSMGRGRPRTLCLSCSPQRNIRVKNI